MSRAILRTRGSSAVMRSGVKNESITLRNAECSGWSRELGTMRWADTPEENVAGSAAAATTSACLNSVTPRGDSATGHAARIQS